MIKLFLKFYFVLAIPLIFLFIPAVNPLYKMINHWVEEYSVNEYKGVFDLLDLELQVIVGESAKQEHIKQLNRHFGCQVALLSMDEVKLSKGKKKRIQNEEIVLQLGPIGRLYKKAAGSENVLALDLDVSSEDQADFAVKGAVYLVNQRLKKIPPEEWPDQVQKLFDKDEMPVEIVAKSETPKAVRENPRLLDGKSIIIEHEENLNTIYAPTLDPTLLYKIGTVDERLLGQRIEMSTRIMPALLLAFGILLLSWPLYRDIRRLRKAAVAFGRGSFEQRVKLGRGASLNPLAIAFNAMAERVQKLISSHKDLTNAVSHELKTPLTRLRFSHEMLRENPADDDRGRYLDNIERDIDDLEEIIGELLVHARYDRPVRPGQFEKVDMYKLLTDTMEPFKESVLLTTLKLHFTGQIPCFCSIEKKAMARAVENLLSNALRYADSKILVSFDCTEKEIILTVEDDGAGVKEADRKRLFEPFVRLDSSRHRKTGGSGLGLAITRQIVEMHGGTIQCSLSRLGGACFTCNIPNN